MTTLSSSLLEFILGLLSNDDELRKYDVDPEAYLEKAGYSGCVDEVDAARKMTEDMRSVSHAKADTAPARADHGNGHADYQVVKEVSEEISENHVTNHIYGPTHHTTHNTSHENNMYGDEYKIWADEDSTVGLPGSITIGGEAEVEGDIDLDNTNSFNDVQNSGDHSQVGVGNSADDEAFSNNGHSNGSGVLISGEDAEIEGDINNASGEHSTANSGTIDQSSSDDDVTVTVEFDESPVTIGEDNQVQSDDANNNTEGTAETGDGDAQLVGAGLGVQDSFDDNTIKDIDVD